MMMAGVVDGVLVDDVDCVGVGVGAFIIGVEGTFDAAVDESIMGGGDEGSLCL